MTNERVVAERRPPPGETHCREQHVHDHGHAYHDREAAEHHRCWHRVAADSHDRCRSVEVDSPLHHGEQRVGDREAADWTRHADQPHHDLGAERMAPLGQYGGRVNW